jgi:peroxin-10
VFSKALYLSLTTLIGSRTLGEEYTDLLYVRKDGRRLPSIKSKIGFILSYALLPYLISRLLKKRFADEEDEKKDDSSWSRMIKGLSYSKILDSLMNLHLALFYLSGSYYNLSKRFFGLRYAFGHKVSPNESVSNGGYEFLGGLIIVQFFFKLLKKSNEVLARKNSNPAIKEKDGGDFKIDGIPRLEDPNYYHHDVNLSDPKVLKYIPESSRKCMLCLSYMTNPSCSTCGHIFCWTCISDWSREHPECPLCRQHLSEQNLLPLR